MELRTDHVNDGQYSEQFLQGVLNRVGVGYHKYGPAKKSDTDRVRGMQERLIKYMTDGNTEWLMDVAAWAMQEFMYPRHDLNHYKPTTSDESPGRPTLQGEHRHDAPDRPITNYSREGD